MSYIYLLQTTNSVYETPLEKSIALDVDDLMRDVGIGSSLDLIKMIEKALKKINEDILRLLFIILQTTEIKSKFEVLVKRSHSLQISRRILNHNIN